MYLGRDVAEIAQKVAILLLGLPEKNKYVRNREQYFRSSCVNIHQTFASIRYAKTS